MASSKATIKGRKLHHIHKINTKLLFVLSIKNVSAPETQPTLEIETIFILVPQVHDFACQ